MDTSQRSQLKQSSNSHTTPPSVLSVSSSGRNEAIMNAPRKNKQTRYDDDDPFDRFSGYGEKPQSKK